ncbi:tetratricopeptide repeat protein [Azospirillum sp. sgz302134]
MVSLSEAYSIALDLHRAGRLDEAAHVYRAILDADPQQADALHLLGVLNGQAGRPGEALPLIAAALALDPEAPDYHDNFGSLLRTTGDARRAARHHERAAALAPQKAKPWFNRGIARADVGETGEALRSYGRALRLDPAYAAASVAAGRALVGAGRAERVVPWLAQALAHAPALADAWATLGHARLETGDADGAVTAYDRAARLRPGDGPTLCNLAMATLRASGAMPEFARPDRPEPTWPGPLRRALDLFMASIDQGGGEVAEAALFRTAVLAIHRGMLDDDQLAQLSARARDRLRRVPDDSAAASMIAHRFYREGRLLAASRLARRHLRRFGEADIRADSQRAKWRQIDARPAFLKELTGYVPRIESAARHFGPPLPLPGNGAILLISADSGYWERFGAWFLSHALATVPQHRLHVHLVNPTDGNLADLERRSADTPGRLSWSAEAIDLAAHAPGAETTYYACARFFVARRLLEGAGVPVFITDIDARCTAGLDTDLREGRGWDLAIMRDRRARGPFDDFIASFLGVAPTATGRAFLDLTCRYIGRFFDRGEASWTLDQAAPYTVFDHLRRAAREPRTLWFEFLRLPYLDFPEKESLVTFPG